MRHLTKWKIFENGGSGNASFNWLIKQKNQNYFKLEEILEMDLFDKYDIKPKDKEFFFDAEDGGDWPTDKFWTYRVKNSSSILEDTANFEKIGEGKEIEFIIIYNIVHDIHDRLVKDLENIKERVKSYTGKELVWGAEEIDSAPGFILYDFILKLQ